jgi:hypothetical protein
MRLQRDQLFLTCTRCGRWPMAIKRIEEGTRSSRVTFLCGACGVEDVRGVLWEQDRPRLAGIMGD